MEIKTDMNQRERNRFAATLESVAQMATKTATALRAGNDMDAIMSFVVFGLTASSLNELQNIVKAAITSAHEEQTLSEFPSEIG